MEASNHQTEAKNYDTMMALGRTLHAALAETELFPDLRVNNSVLQDEAEATIVLESNGSRQWLTPDAMRVLAEFDIAVEGRKRDNWENGMYAEFRVSIPDEVLAAYEGAVESLGVPDAPKEWDDDEKWWNHDNIMSSYRATQEQE